MCILKEKNYAFVHQIKKIAEYMQAIMPTFQTRGVQLESNILQTFLSPPPPSSAPFYTHAHKQINVASKHVIKSFPSKKNAAVFRAGLLTGPVPPAGGFGGRFRWPWVQLSRTDFAEMWKRHEKQRIKPSFCRRVQ